MARGDFPSAKQDQFMVRFPDGMRDRLKADAAENNRSLNAEIIARLQVEHAGEIDEARTIIEGLLSRINQLLEHGDGWGTVMIPGTELLVEDYARLFLQGVPVPELVRASHLLSALRQIERFPRGDRMHTLTPEIRVKLEPLVEAVVRYLRGAGWSVEPPPEDNASD